MSSTVSTPVLGPTKATSSSAATASGTATTSSTTAAGTTASTASTTNNTATTTTTTTTTPTTPDLDDIPPLTLGVMTEEVDKLDALNLVADSIAQQRQTASRALVFYPLHVAGLVAALAAAYRWLSAADDLGTLLTVLSGVVMTYLLGIRYVTASYLRVAEGLRWTWLQDDHGVEDTIIGARYGKEMIGALVLRLEAPVSTSSGRRGSVTSSKTGRGVIRAWTTILRYRHRGIGGDLLREAVQVTRDNCGRDAVVGFAQEHANSTMILPERYNKAFRDTERLAAKTLDKVLAEFDGKRRR